MAQEKNTLTGFRDELDQLDRELINLIGRRIRIAGEVAGYKRDNDIAVMQHDRVAEVQQRNAEHGLEVGLDPSFTRRLYDLIIAEMCRVESEVIDA